MLRILVPFLLFLLFAITLSAQLYQPVFPGLEGVALYDSVVAHYKPMVVLDYANARDTLYARVLSDDDSIHCIYSDHTLYLDRTQDPTQYIYLNGISLGMNTEHAYPQSKGAANGNARSDMHHLYPARIPVNEARGESPYAEIPDAQTQEWFYKAQVLFSIPAQNKDLYSEARATAFEPREAVKGDLARAIFYFYTMYRAEANLADSNFFEQQRPTLCQWHQQDRADSTELIKTWRIAPYQEGKPNPFILDCTLARRLYCPELTSDCATTSLRELNGIGLDLRISPNPLGSQGIVALTLPFAGDLELRLSSLLGQELAKWSLPGAEAGAFSFELTPPVQLSPTPAVLEVRLWQGNRLVRDALKVVLW